MPDPRPTRTYGPAPGARAPRPLRPWKEVERSASGCTACGLARDRTSVVVGDGDPGASLLFLGSAPSRTDDLLGVAFSAGVGNLLDNLLLDGGLTREDVYLCHLVKCRPADDRAPAAQELRACAPHVLDQLAHVDPRVIVTLGELPLRLVLGRDVPLERIAGYRLPLDGVTLVATVDPATALRGAPRLLSQFKRDVTLAVRVATGELTAAEDAAGELGAVAAGRRAATR